MKQLQTHYQGKLWNSLKKAPKHFRIFWHKNFWAKLLVVCVSLFVIVVAGMYGIARWYIATNNDKPYKSGVSFIPAYAESLGVDPKETMDALLNDLGVRHFRLVSYWNQHEPTKGTYDFSVLDWQFEKAEKHNAKVSLSIGLRQPRWPECHMPSWATGQPKEQWQPQLEKYMAAVIYRYKDSPSLASYQLENEYFLESFGHCPDFSRQRLVEEFGLVKRLDPHTPVIMSRSNNYPVIALREPRPDIYAASVYKRVWSPPIGRYFEYPLPAWYYGAVAGLQKIFTGKDTIIHELQAEAWPPNGQGIAATSVQEQNKSFDAKRFKDRIELGKASGMRETYLWGGEYWYYRMVHDNDDSLWNVAKDAF